MQKPIYRLTLAVPGDKYESNILTKEQALEAFAEFKKKHLEAHPDFAEYAAACERSFGFGGMSGRGYDATCYSELPRVPTGEMHRCGRRNEGGPMSQSKEENPDEWILRGDDKICSYCGSVHPMRLIELIKQRGFGLINPSDKNYKWYLNRPEIRNAGFGALKYYRQHDTPEFIAAYNELVSAGIMGQTVN